MNCKCTHSNADHTHSEMPRFCRVRHCLCEDYKPQENMERNPVHNDSNWQHMAQLQNISHTLQTKGNEMETLNGYPVIASRKIGNGSERIIMCDRGPNSRERYVTAYHNASFRNEWALGHYFSDEAQAFKDFDARFKAARND